MMSRSCFSPVRRPVLTSRAARMAGWARFAVPLTLLAAFLLGLPDRAHAGDAPAWMHALVSVPLPAHDEKTDAVLLYSEENLTIQPNGKFKRTTRRAYKILRVGGKSYGVAQAYVHAEEKVLSMRAWCIPAQGRDYEVKDKEAQEGSPGVQYGELVSDLRVKLIVIPASDPGNIVGYEIEEEEHPFVLQDIWQFQTSIPVKEARFSVELPAGWEIKSTWLNYPEVKPTSAGTNQWQWVVHDVGAIEYEEDMPPRRGVAGQLLLTFLTSASDKQGFQTWAEMGKWETNLTQGRRDASPELKQKVAELTTNVPDQLSRMRALANFVQRDIRYVAIELGIGGFQPHPARDTYSHRYGDCKDKATLMSAMLKEIGVDSFYLSINTTRGAVTAKTPPNMYWFNHEILGIKLPDDVKDPSLVATYQHPTLGRVLIFDPTDELTPFGELRGELQANYGLLVTPEGGDLVQLPQLAPPASGIARIAKLSLDERGGLQGEVHETRVGDPAINQRGALRNVQKDADRIKPIETLMAHSLASFQITKATISNLNQTSQPFGYDWTFVAPNYGKTAGGLILVRPRVVGSKTSGLLETKEPRKYPVEFNGPRRDTDTFEIKLPPGYEVDDLPPPADVDFSFGSYHSKVESQGGMIRYTRTFEIRELSVPTDKTDDLKRFYRIIANDERSTAVLKPSGH